MFNEFLVQRVGSILQGAEGKTLEEMIRPLGVSKVCALKWLKSLENDGLVYRTQLMRPGRRGRPRSLYHSTGNLKFIDRSLKGSVVTLDFKTLRSICRYQKGGMCKALLPKLRRCESSLYPYPKTGR